MQGHKKSSPSRSRIKQLLLDNMSTTAILSLWIMFNVAETVRNISIIIAQPRFIEY